MKRLVPLLLIGLLSQITYPTKVVATEYADCVDVVKAGVLSYVLPEYEIKVTNNCKADLGTIYLDFDLGGFSSNINVPRISIWSAIHWETSKIISLRGIKPGYYSPTVKITSTKDYSSKRVKLTSFTISNKSSNGSGISAPQPEQAPTPIAIPIITKCEKIDSEEILVSINDSIKLIESAKSISTGYSAEINSLINSAETLKIDAEKDVCVTAGADLESKIKLAKVTHLADLVSRMKKLIVDMTNLVLAIQKVPAKPKTVITCVKGKSTKKVIAINPKCPTGYKLKV